MRNSMAIAQESDLTEEIRKTILKLARDALIVAAERGHLPPIDHSNLPEILRKPGASFVTLKKNNALRGCIGALEAKLPLVEDIRQHAVAAALYDYRFPAVQTNEVEDISIEVSILTEPTRLEYEDPENLLQLLRPMVDGVILTDGERRATFLPQVWEKIPSPSLFLSMLCEKASLPSNAWQTQKLHVYIYQVETIHEGQTPKETLNP
jgi:AmmeMemoRadiSam system protein A